MNVKQELEAELKRVFGRLGYNKDLACLSVSEIPGVDFQCNASFALAKTLKSNPAEIAAKIAGELTDATVKNGFVNFTLPNETLKRTAEYILKNNKLPLADMPAKTVFFDYGGANIIKELHIGHLRSPIIGEALKRVFQSFGCSAVADVYLGDWGLQMGLALAEIADRGLDINKITLDDLSVIYPTASKRKNQDPEFYNRAADITAKLQNFQEPYYSEYKILRELSVKQIKHNYSVLNCTFDYYNGESTYQPHVAEALTKLKQKGLLRESEGAMIVDVKRPSDNHEIPPIILITSIGGILYAASDVAAIYARYNKFRPAQFIYITDARQSMHFEQVFRCAKLGGLVPQEVELTHIPYGTINGADGKPFRTRDGGTIKLEDIISMVTEAAYAKLVAGGYAKPNKKTAETIGIAALKFADLINNVRRDYIFDVKKCVSFEGKTGPYILYTVARINSLIKKAGIAETDFTNLDKYIEPATRDIIAGIIKLAESYSAAGNNLSLNPIADAVYNLANSFSVFYAVHNIINEPDKDKQIFLTSICRLTKTALTLGLNTLAIDTVENM